MSEMAIGEPTSAEEMAAYVIKRLTDSERSLDDDARDELNKFLSAGAERLRDTTFAEPFSTIEPLKRVSSTIIEQTSEADVVDAISIRKILTAICPLFPFC